MSLREKVLRAHKALLNGSDGLSYFLKRGLSEEVIRSAYVGCEDEAFSYPCIAQEGGLLGVHYKSKARDTKGKRRQWWGGYAEGLPPKGHGKEPDAPAKVIPFGMETLRDLESGSLVVLCCGEEDALSLRQINFTAVSQPGAGLLEPVYAREFSGLDVAVFYDAGEEREARKDALKLRQEGAREARVVRWPAEDPHGADINTQLVEDPEGFKGWVKRMIAEAKPLGSHSTASTASREGEPDVYATSVPQPPKWPELAEAAYHGLPGDIVRAIEPHSEADPVAVLANLLCAFGNAIGRGAHLRVGGDEHHLKLNFGLVGPTSKGRKGQSEGHVRKLMHAIEPTWEEERVVSGLSSGEGLIHEVRDEVWGVDGDGNPVLRDAGVSDKRLLVSEPELARVLKAMNRETNTLSPIVRQAWDRGRLRVMTRTNPIKATDTHISIIGHISKEELLRHLTETEAASGFANRFLWLLVRRSKVLAFGGEWHTVDTAPLVNGLSEALEFGKNVGEIGWGKSARGAWEEVYGPLSEGKLGLFGAVVGRAEAQVVRLATLYAVMDRSKAIEFEHLAAALALWDYAEESARYIFGDATGDPVADQIAEALTAAGQDGLTRTDVRDLFKRHKSADRIDQALTLLLKAGRARRTLEGTGGRPTERWFLK